MTVEPIACSIYKVKDYDLSDNNINAVVKFRLISSVCGDRPKRYN